MRGSLSQWVLARNPRQQVGRLVPGRRLTSFFPKKPTDWETGDDRIPKSPSNH